MTGFWRWVRDENGFWALLLVALTVLAYLPALRGGFIWDDDMHLTANPCIVGPLGFKEIWTSSAATYYPLVLSSFWVQHALWGLNPLPYHLVNIAVHAASVLLLWLVLRCLQVRGAWLGAALWGLHPVQAESVAWITELKNTQSGLFYLLAIWFFLKWRAIGTFAGRKGTEWDYALALVCAALAILSKASTVMLPVVLGLVWWWGEGRWRWRNIFRLAPFFIISAAASGWTIWEQQYHSGALGLDWSQTWLERLVIAGKVVWFYLGKLLWPHPLIFIYPRWEIDVSRPLVWLPVLALGVSLFLLWLNRRGRSRPMFFAFAYFVVSLFPVLGFFNVYFFRYSFVGDHFQYLASMGPLALAAVAISKALDFFKRERLFLEPALGAAVLLVLGALTWRQCGTFSDMQTLWRTTLAQNPDCWMAHSNLGLWLKDQGRIDEAINEYHQALQLAPNAWDALNDTGVALAAKGQFDEAITNYRKSLEMDPSRFAVQNNLGFALAAEKRFDEAMECYHRALQLNPNYADALNNLGNALAAMGRPDEAIESYRQAIRINPNFAEALNNLGVILAAEGQLDEAITNYQRAVRVKPNNYNALEHLGAALTARGRLDDAVQCYRQAIQANPNRPEPYFQLGATFDALGHTREAVAEYREALKLDPNLTGPLNNLAWALATSPDAALRDGAEAVQLAKRACELSHESEPMFLGTLAAAFAEAGRFPEAVTTAEKAERLAGATGSEQLAAALRQQLELYRAGKPCREPAPTRQ